MGISAVQLLSGPRGRQLCLELALAWEEADAPRNAQPDPGDPGAFDSGTWSGAHPLWTALYPASAALDPNANGVGYSFAWDPDGPQPTLSELHQARNEHAAKQSTLRADPRPAIESVTKALNAIPSRQPTGPQLHHALAATAGGARGWQAPDGTDVLLNLQNVRQALHHVALAVAQSPLSIWWDREVQLDDQWMVDHMSNGAPRRWLPTLSAWTALERWAEALAAQEREGSSDQWWSFPSVRGTEGWGLVSSCGTLPAEAASAAVDTAGTAGGDWGELAGAGTPTAFSLLEDSPPQGPYLQAARYVPPQQPRILEIRSAEDWASLCARHPASAHHAYGDHAREALYLDGSERSQRWVLPDWRAVAREFDGVHLTVSGYLSCATQAIEVPGYGASGITGWDPDETYWLCSPALQEPPNESNGSLRTWEQDAQGAWTEKHGPHA